jgi:ABC-2 type transport system ATP-binding protein
MRVAGSTSPGSGSAESASTSGERPVIHTVDVEKIFSSGDGVSRLDLSVPAATIFGFVGPSGSGKTTTVRMLTGALRPTKGTVRVFGGDPARFDSQTRSRLGYMPQQSVLYPEMTVEENLRFLSALYGVGGQAGNESRANALDFVDLGEHAGKRVDQISGGMRRRLSLAAALAHEPELLFLDEPTAGIDPVLRRRVWDHLVSLRDSGRSLFVTTQNVGEAMYCDLVGLISDGELIHVDSPDALRRKAIGGDVVVVEIERPFDTQVADSALRGLSIGSVEWKGVSSVELVVESAGSSIPRIAGELTEKGISVSQIEESMPMFDDVFVALVERHREDRAVVT